MSKSRDSHRSIHEKIIQEYKDRLKNGQPDAYSDKPIFSVAPAKSSELTQPLIPIGAMYEEAQEKIKRSFGKFKSDLNDTLDTIENKFVSQYKQLGEMREVVELERKTLEDIYNVRIPPDSLAAIVNLKKETRNQWELEFEQQKKEFEEFCRTRRIELAMEEEAIQEQKIKAEKDFDEKKRKFQELLENEKKVFEDDIRQKRQELARLESAIDERQRLQEVGFEERLKQLAHTIDTRQNELDRLIESKQQQINQLEAHMLEKRRQWEEEVSKAQENLEESLAIRRRSFDEEMNEKRANWQAEELKLDELRKQVEKDIMNERSHLEQELVERQRVFWESLSQERGKWKEEEENLQKQWFQKQRELEENQRQFQNAKEFGELSAAKIKQEFDIKLREIEMIVAQKDIHLTDKQAEIEALRRKVDQFSKELEKVVQNTEQSLGERMQLKLTHEMERARRDYEEQLQVRDREIELLTSKLREKDGVKSQVAQEVDTMRREYDSEYKLKAQEIKLLNTKLREQAATIQDLRHKLAHGRPSNPVFNNPSISDTTPITTPLSRSDFGNIPVNQGSVKIVRSSLKKR